VFGQQIESKREMKFFKRTDQCTRLVVTLVAEGSGWERITLVLETNSIRQF